IWELLSGKEVRKFVGHDYAVSEVAFAPDTRTVLTAGPTEALLWDVRPDPLKLSTLQSLWSDLQSSDAVRAYRAVWELVSREIEAPAMLGEKIAPVGKSEQEHFRKLIADLDNPNYAARNAAMSALREKAGGFPAALRAAADSSPPLEVKR